MKHIVIQLKIERQLSAPLYNVFLSSIHHYESVMIFYRCQSLKKLGKNRSNNRITAVEEDELPHSSFNKWRRKSLPQAPTSFLMRGSSHQRITDFGRRLALYKYYELCFHYW